MKYKSEFLKHFGKFQLFTFDDAGLFLSDMGASQYYIRKFISIMLKTGRLNRITKGYYTLNKEIEIIGYAFKPFYYGLGTSLIYYDLSEQQASQTVITTKMVREGVREIFGVNVVIKRIPKSLYFGYNDVMGERFHFYLSDIEKTLLDMIYFNYTVEEYVYKNIFRQVNKNRINGYLKKYSDRVRLKFNILKKTYRQ